MPQRVRQVSPALKLVLTVGIMSFFADFTYEGSRSIIGPYLGALGVGALGIAVITGAGEFLGYGLRLVSGRAADRTGRYWPITISGYVVQMAAVPLLALAGSWPIAALLIIAERIGKATRNPLIAAAVAPMVSPGRRASAFGLFTGAYGIAWMLGSIVIGLLYDVSLGLVVAFTMIAQFAALPFILLVRRHTINGGSNP